VSTILQMRTFLCLVALACIFLPAAASYDTDEQELAETYRPIKTLLLDEAAHKKMVKASYQSNVKTIYFHLEEIIKKILAHKTKWTLKYNGDLAKIAKEVLKHKNLAKNKEKKWTKAKEQAEGAKALSKNKHKSWNKAKNKYKQKKTDAKMAKKQLKNLYLKGLKQKEGEICMIRKIQCMVAKFNGEASLQKKYCGACSDEEPKKKAAPVTWSVVPGYCPGKNGKKKDNHGTGEDKLKNSGNMGKAKFVAKCKAKCAGQSGCSAFILLYKRNNKNKGVNSCNFKSSCSVKKYKNGDRDVYLMA